MKYFLLRHVDQTKSPVCGCAMLNPGWRHMKRKLESESVLIIGRKNSTLIDEECETLEVKQNRMVLLPAGHLHVGHEDITKPVSYYWFHFYQRSDLKDEQMYFLPKSISEDDLKSFFKNADGTCMNENDIILPQVLDIKNKSKVYDLCTEIMNEYAKPTFSSLMYNVLIQRLLLELSNEYINSNKIQSEKQENAATSLVRKVLILIEAELSNSNASVKYFANDLKVNQDYLGRCFKEVMKFSMGQYIREQRVALACSRLREKNDGIEIIASQCGFGSKRQFYEEFKKTTGKTPASYRAESAYIGINSL